MGRLCQMVFWKAHGVSTLIQWVILLLSFPAALYAEPNPALSQFVKQAYGYPSVVLSASNSNFSPNPLYKQVSHLVEKTVFESFSSVHQRMLASRATKRFAPGEPVPFCCFAPGTPEEKIAAFEQAMYGSGKFRPLGHRWYYTATEPSLHSQGDPTIITYSFAPDGTPISPAYEDESSAGSSLMASFDAAFGSRQTWQDLFHQMFQDWSEVCGVTYVYEPNDDGVEISQGNTGALGVRGDVRIVGHPIDGLYSTLAYNWSPDYGDMILDTDDSPYFSNSSGNYLRLRNTIAHEHGHGLGMGHTCPLNQTKLMEPMITTSFDGPRHDEILNGQRNYGDPQEPNDSSVKAVDLGMMYLGTTTVSNVSIDGSGDQDYFVFSVPADKSVALTLTPYGFTYLEGDQNNNGSCSAGSNFDSTTISNIAVSLISQDGTTVLASADANPAGGSENIATFVLWPGAGSYFIRIYPGSSAANNVQMYTLDIDIDDAPGAPTRTPTLSPTITQTPTITLTPTSTITRTPTRTRTFTRTGTFTRTATPTATRTATRTATVTQTPSRTRTATGTPTSTRTSTPTPTWTRTFTTSPTATSTGTATRTLTPSPSATPLPPTATPTATQSLTATSTASPTRTSTPSPSPTQTGTRTYTSTRTSTLTATPTFTRTSTRTATPTPTRSSTPSPTASPNPTPSPTATGTQTQTQTPSHTPENTATATFTATATSTRTSSNTPSPTRTVTETPTVTASPTSSPTATSSPTFTTTPTRTQTLTQTPTRTGTPSPTETRTTTPTATPTSTLTETATPAASPTSTSPPTSTQTPVPTATPTAILFHAIRTLPEFYIPGEPFTVSIQVYPDSGATNWSVEDSPQYGWTITQINEDGIWDSVNLKVKWGPFFDSTPRDLTYQVTAPVNANGEALFEGTYSSDGTLSDISGEVTIDPHYPHPADMDRNWVIDINQMTAYSSAWRKGLAWAVLPNPIPINYVTNAGFIWKTGEIYYYDEIPSPPQCWIQGNAPATLATPSRKASAGIKRRNKMISTVTRSFMPEVYTPEIPVVVTLSVNPDSATFVHAVEDSPPPGWIIDSINENGIWDPVNLKVKWGPYFDALPRQLQYHATPPAGESGEKVFNGVGSFDGSGVMIEGSTTLHQSPTGIMDWQNY